MDRSTKIESNRLPGLTPRVLLMVLLIAPINCYFLVQMELVRYTFPTWTVPLSNVIFILMVIMTLNYPVRWIAPRIALRPDELLVLYVMLSLITTLAACDTIPVRPAGVRLRHWRVR